jgi:hypothetical protein
LTSSIDKREIFTFDGAYESQEMGGYPSLSFFHGLICENGNARRILDDLDVIMLYRGVSHLFKCMHLIPF